MSSISTFGFSQRVSESGVLGIGVMSMDFGDIEITTVDMLMEVLVHFLRSL